MTKILKYFLSVSLILAFFLFTVTGVFAETLAKDDTHSLSLTLPENYLLLNTETAEDNVELIESLGYSLSSFKSYLKSNENGEMQTLFLGVDPSSKAQITVKSWSTDFSKKIGNLALLDDEALSKTAKELVSTNGASYKSVSANQMKLIEVRSNDKDSGGNFCSVQYITICNSNFYSLNFTFTGNIDDQKVNVAWETLATFKIKTDLEKDAWDFGSVLIVVLLSLAILAAVVIAIVIIYTIIRDVKNRKTDPNEAVDFIERRK